MDKPKPFDMRKMDDVKRWFNEMEAYLIAEDFENRGTDFTGRQFAMGGFMQFRDIMLKDMSKADICVGLLECNNDEKMAHLGRMVYEVLMRNSSRKTYKITIDGKTTELGYSECIVHGN